MTFIELFLLAIALSMDAFAVAVCTGLTMGRATPRKAAVVGLYFGISQALMPVIGYVVATWFAEGILAYGHWVAFGLLGFLGVKMMLGSFRKNECAAGTVNLGPARMLPLALATSVDALAVGVTFAFLRVNIAAAASLIGVATFCIAMLGVYVGGMFGTRFKSKAEFAGGAILVLIGLRILAEHLM